MPLGSFKPQALWTLLCGLPFPVVQRRLKGNADLLHATDHFIPKLRDIPVVATLHDAIPLSHPEWINYSFKSLKNALWRKSAHWAEHVITVSEYSKQEIIRWFGLAPERISVTPLGVDERWFGESSSNERARVRQQHELPARYFLFVGTLQPRKNMATLIRAHRALPPELRRTLPLVVAGRAGWMCEKEASALRDGDGGTLRYLGHVTEQDLPTLMRQAAVFVLPSLHEGFGLPVLEAFAAGTPVVASQAGAIPEVAGDAALLVDPLDAAGMARAMQHAATDLKLAETLRAKGTARAKEFTWQRTAELTVQVYRSLLERLR